MIISVFLMHAEKEGGFVIRHVLEKKFLKKSLT